MVKRKPAITKLAYPITLTDGRKVETLANVVAVINSLPERRQIVTVWQTTMAMLLGAKASGKPIDMKHATGQLARALPGGRVLEMKP